MAGGARSELVDRGAGQRPALDELPGSAYAAEIERRCGVHHSVRAVKMHRGLTAHWRFRRYAHSAAPWARRSTGRRGCADAAPRKHHLAQGRAFNEQLEREHAADIDDVRPERDKMRRRNSRLCRKYGLKGSASGRCDGILRFSRNLAERRESE